MICRSEFLTLNSAHRSYRRSSRQKTAWRVAAPLLWLCVQSLSPEASRATSLVPLTGALGFPEPLVGAAQRGAYPTGTHLLGDRPHPAVARIVVPEGHATSYGSGTLVDARGQFGLVVTNWHVVRDGWGEVEVVFPDGFRSKARPVKVDPDWDLAALVVWRPPAPPVTMTEAAPQPGDQLTICGYGSGQYRAATGRCTRYYSPAIDLPQHMVELDVEARQGDSGGPIFNERGELAGVLFGAGRGTTLGSFGGRVGSFLASLAPDIGCPTDNALVQAKSAAPNCELENCQRPENVGSGSTASALGPTVADADGATTPTLDDLHPATPREELAALWIEVETSPNAANNGWHAAATSTTDKLPVASASPPSADDWSAQAKNVLAVIGVLAVVGQLLRAAR